VPTEKRARQKAARQAKKAAEARRARLRKRLRSGGFVLGGGAVVLLLVLLSTGVLTGGSSPPKGSSTKKPTPQAAANTVAVRAGCPASTTKRVNTTTWSTPPAMTIDTSKAYSATVKTTAGTFDIALDASSAPTTVNNFVFLADKGFYKCNTFHRVIPGFMDQTGDPTGTGRGGPGYEFANENVPTAYASGDVAMANSGGTDTDGSQFFVLVPGGTKTLNSDLAGGNKYSLFGKVTSGMSVVKKINSEGGTTATGKPKVVQRILSVTIHES
jgi:cyclophilin family peptidyl-prolyl cis-trans isomerase